MSRSFSTALSLLVAGAIAFGFPGPLSAQAQSLPEGYVARKEVTARGLAPGMTVKELGRAGRTFQVTFHKGDEVASGLTEFAERNHITAAHFTGVGAFGSALLGWTDLDKRAFKKIEINQEVEVVSFAGDITLVNGKPSVHAHTVVAFPDGSTKGGHFIEGHVSIIMDLFVVDTEPGPAGQSSR